MSLACRREITIPCLRHVHICSSLKTCFVDPFFLKYVFRFALSCCSSTTSSNSGDFLSILLLGSSCRHVELVVFFIPHFFIYLLTCSFPYWINYNVYLVWYHIHFRCFFSLRCCTLLCFVVVETDWGISLSLHRSLPLSFLLYSSIPQLALHI